MRVSDHEIPIVAETVRKLCGIVLDRSKGYLIESRLGTVAASAGCSSYEALCADAAGSKTLQNEIINAITTGETLFFRDASPFQALQHKVLPELIDAKMKTSSRPRIRIWSAACSSGQEVYSIAMTIADLVPDYPAWDIRILGSDISEEAIAHASRGNYREHEVRRGLDAARLRKHFRKSSRGWQVDDALRSMATFQQRNLMTSFGDVGQFDIIFCRNVAIYFEYDTKRDVFARLCKQLTRDGYLFVGSSESLNALDPRFVPQHHCRAVFYRPNMTLDAAPARSVLSPQTVGTP